MKKHLLILLSGYGAAGKTTLGKSIFKKFDIPFISTDGIKEVMWDNIGWEYEREKLQRIAKTSFELAYYFIESSLSSKKSIIVDANFYPEFNNERIDKLKNKHNCEVLQIYCYADKDVIEKRFVERLDNIERHPGYNQEMKTKYGDKESFLKKVGTGNHLLDIEGETIKFDTSNICNEQYGKVYEFVDNYI